MKRCLSFSLLRNSPRLGALVARNIGWQLSEWYTEHHYFCSFLPFSVPLIIISFVRFLIRSRSWEWPMSGQEFASIVRSWYWIRYNTLSVFPCSLHTMSLYIDMKMVLPLNCSSSHCDSVIKNLNLFKHSQCCESCEIFSTRIPSALHRFGFNSLRLASFQTPFYLVFPGLNWFSTGASQTWHRVC